MRAPDVYRALLWCYPAEFRNEYGREMMGAFTAQLRDAQHAGRRGAIGIWLTTLVDLIPTALREHRHVIQQDLRHAVRVFAATPGFTAVAALSLALGIGANVAIFSLLNSVLLSALPVPHPETLVVLTDPSVAGVSQGQEDGDRSLLTYPEFVALQHESPGLQSLMAAQSRADRLDVRIGGAEPEEVSTRLVSASYFSDTRRTGVRGAHVRLAVGASAGYRALCGPELPVLAAPLRWSSRHAWASRSPSAVRSLP